MQLNFLLALFTMKSKITNLDLPICSNCVYFVPYNDPNFSNLSLCTKFGEKNLITGKIKFIYAQYSREDESKCGRKGVWFTPNINENE